MKQIHILHLGIGNVGKRVIQQISSSQKRLIEHFSTQFLFHGLFTSKSGLVSANGLSADMALQMLKSNKTSPSYSIEKLIQKMPMPFVLIDTTASDETVPYIISVLKKRGFVVLSNKKPLAGIQELFDTLHKLGGQRIFYETVVGAGLPVIKTIKDMQDSGDEIVEIQGCLSGTLGFIFSELDKGRLFSEVVVEAKKKRFTEPDPRDDLSGIDVARKLLILSRLLGRKMELQQINLVSLCPIDMKNLSADEFLKQLSKIDKSYKEKIVKAKKKNKVLRFIGEINNQGSRVGLQEVDELSDFGRLKGPDNLVVIKTKRYFSNPLVIKGPGAGIEVTAAGVLADMLEIAKKHL